MKNKSEVIYTENKVRAILKKPNENPEIVRISVDDIPKLANPGTIYPGYDECEWSSQITMYYSDGKYNFEIGFHTYNGNVLFAKSKYHHSCGSTKLCSLTDYDITKICALMKWELKEGGEI